MSDAATPLEPTEVVLRFLESVGRRSDAEFYLSVFRASAKERFACISVDGPVIAAALDAVVLDLRFLSVLGLVPVVVLGVFDAANAPLHAGALEVALRRQGVTCKVIPAGDTGDALAAAVTEAARDGVLPVVPFDQHTGGTEEARFGRVADLVTRLRSEKLIFLQRRGGLRQKGKVVPLVNLTHDFDSLVQSVDLSRKQRALLTLARRLVCEQAPYRLTVAIASPLELLRELFTMKGAGTFLRRGATIARYEAWDGVDQPRLRGLLVSAFSRVLEDAFFDKPPWRVYLDDDYRGAAVLIDTPLGAYLSKFAVERQAQGEGIGGDLWQRVTEENPRIFWRSRADNPIDAWYVRQCHGLLRLPEWNVFWIGFAPQSIADAVNYAISQPADFKSPDWT